MILIIKNVIPKNAIKNTIIQNTIIQNTIIKNNVVKNNVVKNNVVKNNVVKKRLVYWYIGDTGPKGDTGDTVPILNTIILNTDRIVIKFYSNATGNNTMIMHFQGPTIGQVITNLSPTISVSQYLPTVVINSNTIIIYDASIPNFTRTYINKSSSSVTIGYIKPAGVSTAIVTLPPLQSILINIFIETPTVLYITSNINGNTIVVSY